MEETLIGGLHAEIVPIDTGADALVYQYRLRTVYGECFTYQVEVSTTAFVEERGYHGDVDAMSDAIRLEVARRIAEGRHEDLILRRHSSGWMAPEAPEGPLMKHSGQ